MLSTVSVSESSLTSARSGFWRRFAAALIDGIALGVVSGILRVILGTAGGEGLGLVVSLGYYTFFHGKTGQTPGDAVMSIRVVDFRDRPGQPIGYGRALGRALMSIVSGVVLLLGYLWMLWDSEKQTWHDKVVGSVVVPARG
jgi:uncharacterized RDD family membrane protein YckC